MQIYGGDIMFRYAKFSIFIALFLGLLVLITTPIVWSGELRHSSRNYEQDGGATPAFIVPLFPLKLKDLMKMKGLPPGMTLYSFWAARGTVALTKLPDGKVKLAFSFKGLIPYGVYTLWNVLETDPFKDEALGEFGAGKHSVVSDGNGRAHKVVVLNKWPGKEFLLDYHADGGLSQSKGVYPGALWGKFPPEPKR
jgi:hypothetical protein